MAVIRITSAVKKQIIDNCVDMFRKQHKTAQDSVPEGWGDRVYYLLFSSDEIAAAEMLPAGWCDTHSNLVIDEVRNAPGYGSATTKLFPHIKLEYSPARMFPKTFNSARHGVDAQAPGYGLCLRRNDQRWAELLVEVDAWQARKQEVIDRQVAFVANVTKLLDTFATIAPALKEWPPLWDLMPEAMREQHRKIVERTSTKASRVEGVDMGSMTAQVVAHKMTKGG